MGRVRIKWPRWRWPAHEVSAVGAPKLTRGERLALKRKQGTLFVPEPEIGPDGKRVVR